MKRSTGILMYRHSGRRPMVLLVHPGGPFWRNKDRNSWSIPKGIEWPPKSGRLIRVAEVDRAEWFTLDDARDKIIKGQSVFLDRLEQILRPMPSI